MINASQDDYRNAVAANLINHSAGISDINSTLNDTAAVNGTSGVLETHDSQASTLGVHTSQLSDLDTTVNNITGGISGSPYIFIFGRNASTGNIWYSQWTGTLWTAWINIGGSATVGSLQWTYGPSTRVDVFCVSSANNAMYHKWLDTANNVWTPSGTVWESLGGSFS